MHPAAVPPVADEMAPGTSGPVPRRTRSRSDCCTPTRPPRRSTPPGSSGSSSPPTRAYVLIGRRERARLI